MKMKRSRPWNGSKKKGKISKTTRAIKYTITHDTCTHCQIYDHTFCIYLYDTITHTVYTFIYIAHKK